jgi:hypothetical protein
VRLDDLACALPTRPALVKLDVEGAEVKALRGASELIAGRRTRFIIEVEPQHLRRQGATVDELRELFAGYVPYVIVATDHGFDLSSWTDRWDDLPTTDLVLRPVDDDHGGD